MGKPFSYWSDEALDRKAQHDVEKEVFEQPPGWLGNTQPGDDDYDRYHKSWHYHHDKKK